MVKKILALTFIACSFIALQAHEPVPKPPRSGGFLAHFGNIENAPLPFNFKIDFLNPATTTKAAVQLLAEKLQSKDSIETPIITLFDHLNCSCVLDRPTFHWELCALKSHLETKRRAFELRLASLYQEEIRATTEAAKQREETYYNRSLFIVENLEFAMCTINRLAYLEEKLKPYTSEPS